MVVLHIKKNDFGEYEVVWEENGKRDEAKTYYTDDLEDAKNTFIATLFQAQKQGYEIRVKGNKFIPDMFRELGG